MKTQQLPPPFQAFLSNTSRTMVCVWTLFLSLSLATIQLNAQSIDERYHLHLPLATTPTMISDPITLDYSTTTNFDNSGYIAVSATRDNPLGGVSNYGIKVVEFDNNGGYLGTGKFLYPVPPEVTNLFPLKVITLNGNQGYAITGYFKHFSSTCPRPFVVKLDIALNITAQHFYNDCGFFTDIDQMPNGDFMFVGAWSDSMTKLANRRGAIMRTDMNMNPVYARNVDYFVPTSIAKDYDIVHDMSIIDDNHAYITGTYTAECDTTGSATSGRLLFGEVDLLNGDFNWTNNCFDTANLSDFGARVIFNNDYIVVAANSRGNFVPNISFFNRTTHNLVSSYYVEHLKTALIVGDSLLTHIPFLQNIYFIDSTTVFYSGKDYGVFTSANPSWHFEIPFSGQLDINGNVANGLVFVTDQHYVAPLPLDITSYFDSDGNCGQTDSPLYASSNTLPQNGEQNTFITITHDRINNLDNKTWIFSSDNNVCSSKELRLLSDIKTQENTIITSNIIRINPAKIDLLLNIEDIRDAEVDCDQDPN
jgi:hypothetical protein